MNYYEHHIGDYAEATAHLSFVEDAAYSRLIRKVYATEKPLPADIKAAQRLIGARTKEERDAVETVLHEFFTLHDDGWHNKRCDEEIARYKEGDEEREQRQANEKERMRRHREERARLFEELRAHGIIPKWDTTVTQLRDLLKRTSNAPATRTGDEQERTSNAPATANQTPDTRHHTSPSLRSGEERARASRLPTDWELPDDWRCWAAQTRPELDLSVTAAKFADYWHSKPGKDGCKLDWKATWRNWVREERGQQRGQYAPMAAPTLKYAGAAAAIFDGATHV